MNSLDTSLIVALIFNICWFAGGFHFFCLIPHKAALLLRPDIPPGDERTKLAIASMRFIGGFNFAFLALSLMGVLQFYSSGDTSGKSLLLSASAIAHGSQFALNLPPLVQGGLKGGAPWDVVSNPRMLFIFVMDLLGMILNLIPLF